jgi:hypothetical protein
LGFNEDEVVLGEDITSIVVAMKRKEKKIRVKCVLVMCCWICFDAYP